MRIIHGKYKIRICVSDLGVAFIAYSESLLRMPGSFIFALLFYFMQTVVSMGALVRV